MYQSCRWNHGVFSDPSCNRLSPKENDAVGASAAVVFCMERKIDT